MRFKTDSRVAKLRSGLGMTQEHFAKLMGVHFATVNRWENLQTQPSALASIRLSELEKMLCLSQAKSSAGARATKMWLRKVKNGSVSENQKGRHV